MIKKLTSHVVIRYLISGGTAAISQLLVLFLLNNIFGVYYLFAATIGFLCAFVVSFSLHKWWTFRREEEEYKHGQAIKYFFVCLTGLLINNIFLYILVNHFNIKVIFAQVIAIAFIACFSFFVSRNIIFKYSEI